MIDLEDFSDIQTSVLKYLDTMHEDSEILIKHTITVDFTNCTLVAEVNSEREIFCKPKFSINDMFLQYQDFEVIIPEKYQRKLEKYIIS